MVDKGNKQKPLVKDKLALKKGSKVEKMGIGCKGKKSVKSEPESDKIVEADKITKQLHSWIKEKLFFYFIRFPDCQTPFEYHFPNMQ